MNTFGEYGQEDAPGADKIMHAQLETGSGFTIAASDTRPGCSATPATPCPSA